ncbi:unnamed protein product [Parnassius apollo]|uniref:(apollo) hypothetical protein n=1 Tax=Parnassius apollo TaxID=110799 RepID=A0A8S3W6D6_PARAO|nr:unnamed protein product [Parnassius apollo]
MGVRCLAPRFTATAEYPVRRWLAPGSCWGEGCAVCAPPTRHKPLPPPPPPAHLIHRKPSTRPTPPLAKPSPLTPITSFASRAVGDDVRETLCDVNSPRNEFFLRSPRGEIASVYLDKLDAVSRCLGRVLDSPRQPHTPHLPPHSPRDVP